MSLVHRVMEISVTKPALGNSINVLIWHQIDQGPVSRLEIDVHGCRQVSEHVNNIRLLIQTGRDVAKK